MAQITQIQIFGSAAFGEIKYHSLRATPQKKNIALEVLSLCLRKKVFSGVPVSAFLFMAQITQILLSLGMLLLERSKITVWEWHLFKKKFCYGSFEFVCLTLKGIFSGTS